MRFDELFCAKLKRYRLIRDVLKGKIILDLGSSQGGMHSWLAANYKGKIIGVDINKDADVQADLNHPFPFDNNYADSIIAGEIIEHVHNPLNFLKECRRVLKPGGRLVLTTPNMTGLHYIFNENVETPSSNPHLYAWNKTFLTRLAKKAGFNVEKICYINVFWNRNILFRIICRIIPKLRPDIFLVAHKPTVKER